MTEVEIDGRKYVLCNAGGEIRALDGICPHAGGPLAHGALHGETMVCPWHAWEFNSRTGEHDFDPRVRVATYPARVEGDEILIDVSRPNA